MEELDLDMIIKLLSEAVEEGSSSALKMRQQLFDWAWSRFDADILDRLWNLGEQPQDAPQDNNPDSNQNDEGSASLWKQRLYDEIAALTGQTNDVPLADEAKFARFNPSKVLQPVTALGVSEETSGAATLAGKNGTVLAD